MFNEQVVALHLSVGQRGTVEEGLSRAGEVKAVCGEGDGGKEANLDPEEIIAAGRTSLVAAAVDLSLEDAFVAERLNTPVSIPAS